MDADSASNNCRVLIHAADNQILIDNGVAIVDLPDPSIIDGIEDAYWATVPPGGSGITIDYLRSDRTIVRRLNDLLVDRLKSVEDNLFSDHFIVYASFVAKEIIGNSSLFLHRDVTAQDERLGRCWTLWIPLTDTSELIDNGPLASVPHSHKLKQGTFGPNAIADFAPYTEYLNSKLIAHTVTSGQALIYDASILHASPSNRSGRPRVAVACMLGRRGVRLTQTIATGRRHRLVHEVDRDYFLDYAPSEIAQSGIPSKYPVVDEYDEEPIVDTGTFLNGFPRDADESLPQRMVIVPEDLMEGFDPCAGPPDHRRYPIGDALHDIQIAVAGMDPVTHPAVVAATGPVGQCALGSLDNGVHFQVASASEHVSIEGSLSVICIWPSGRVTLQGDPDPVTITIVECTPIRSGIRVGSRAMELDRGVVLDTAGSEPAQLWNDGPGPLVFLASQFLPTTESLVAVGSRTGSRQMVSRWRRIWARRRRNDNAISS